MCVNVWYVRTQAEVVLQHQKRHSQIHSRFCVCTYLYMRVCLFVCVLTQAEAVLQQQAVAQHEQQGPGEPAQAQAAAGAIHFLCVVLVWLCKRMCQTAHIRTCAHAHTHTQRITYTRTHAHRHAHTYSHAHAHSHTTYTRNSLPT